MKIHAKAALLAGVAAGTLVLAGPASAFDNVNWQWNKLVSENVTIDGNIDVNLNPSGMFELEKLQLFIGDAIASSNVSGIDNNQPSDGGAGTIDFTVAWSGVADDSGDPSTFGTDVLGGPQASLGGDLSGAGDLSGTHDEGSDAVALTATFTDIAVNVDPSGSFDATTELPEVVSAATAVANNQSLESDVSMQLHDTQVVFGGFNSESDPSESNALQNTGNTGLSAALAMVVAGSEGIITPATVQATSTVSDILNATVDSAATAVANNANVELAAATPDDAFLMADYTQAAFANVSAASSVTNVSLNSYTNLGTIDRPIVNSVATAVGNNMNIKVTAPVPGGS
jgi:hypothetical protein